MGREPVRTERLLAYEMAGIALLAVGVILLVNALRADEGMVPMAAVRVLRFLFGVGVYLLPLFLIFMGAVLVARGSGLSTASIARGFGAAFFVVVIAAHLALPSGAEFAPGTREDYGGLVGAAVIFALRRTVGNIGSWVVVIALGMVAFLLLSNASLTFLLRSLMTAAVATGRFLKAKFKLLVFQRSAPAPEAERKSRRAPRRSPEPTQPSPQPPEPTAGNAGRGTRRRATLQLPSGVTLPEYFREFVSALDPPTAADMRDTETSVEAGIRLVEDTLASFRIEAKVREVKRGPVITRYEVEPAPGIRVSRIANLADDLALALAAIDVRVEAPVPGKSVIGIEVPNKRIHFVRMRELIELDEFLNAPSKLTFALGKDIAGQPKFADLTRMPHLLIAGATNSGKSVCLNAIITSILARATPEEVKLSLIDPKRVELTLYKDIPHLFHPVVVDAKEAVRALRGAIAEMERRYKLFAERGVRNIQSFNSKLAEGEEPLYYILIVIDELADLMMQAAAEFERLICRIAQLARATGIHLVIATQRPSVNVITGVIKANISSRIAFAVASQVDSRTILDCNGAERLIGSGDMLFHPIDAPKPLRIQGAYVSEEEVNRVVQTLSQWGGAPSTFPLDLGAVEEQMQAEARAKAAAEERDPLFEEAVALVRRRGMASASMLQREFEIGYPRAGRLIDQLEKAGIIGPQEGSKPREILVGPLTDEGETALSRAEEET
ncbi:MAG: DNA translocase FtsK [Abditibacteriales bacterium]|nr:DNA translocase FtsK [Abditibacteriales bacterium]MDW8364411.1 DNA translocase FtsK 4TM domain-containing protein [Abditibacteriales bacterium]